MIRKLLISLTCCLVFCAANGAGPQLIPAPVSYTPLQGSCTNKNNVLVELALPGFLKDVLKMPVFMREEAYRLTIKPNVIKIEALTQTGVYRAKTTLEQVMDIFPSKFIHIGGDEAVMKDWPVCVNCRRRMQEEGYTDVHQLQGYLNYYQDLIRKEPAACGELVSLRFCYGYEPITPAMDADHILGLQGNLWCEYISTPEHAEYMLYPRMFAIAETGWSPAARKDFFDFRGRAYWLCGIFHDRDYRTFDLDGESEPARSGYQCFEQLEASKK